MKHNVICIDLKGNETTYPSLTAARSATGIPESRLRKLAKTAAFHVDGMRVKLTEAPKVDDSHVLSLRLSKDAHAKVFAIAAAQETSVRRYLSGVIEGHLSTTVIPAAE